jgi:dipeptidyl aminopeptidase/acylaminoacyl peptidase
VHAVDIANVKARNLMWASDDVVVLLASDSESLFGVRGNIEFEGAFGVDLSRHSAIKPLSRANIEGLDPDTGEVLVPGGYGDQVVLYAVNPKNDRRRIVSHGDSTTVGWMVDGKGAPLVQIEGRRNLGDRSRDESPRGILLSFMTRDKGGWRTILTETAGTPGIDPVGLDAGGKAIVGSRREAAGRYGLYALPTESGKLEPYFVDDKYDVSGIETDPYTNLVVGVRVDGEQSKVTWFDEEIGQRQRELEPAFHGAATRLVSWSRDRRRYIAAVGTGEEPTTYFLYDVETKSARSIGSAYPEARKAGVAPRLSMLYPARDKVMIPAYLTMADDLHRPAPLIVLPHGGPESRDVGGFDWLAHFLASRGYIVLQPEFRGSDGYTTAWRDAGRGGWGTGVMQNDVTDGVKALVANGYADPKRVCIVGASYGGYAALAGAVFTPELYRCAVAIAPVTDLNDMIAYEGDHHGLYSPTVDYWKKVIGGDLGAAHGRFAELSPINHAQSVRAPILLIHGKDDSIVPISQSRNMKSVLEGAGKAVELIELQGEDHWLSRADTRLQTLEALDAFLAKNLKQ